MVSHREENSRVQAIRSGKCERGDHWEGQGTEEHLKMSQGIIPAIIHLKKHNAPNLYIYIHMYYYILIHINDF